MYLYGSMSHPHAAIHHSEFRLNSLGIGGVLCTSNTHSKWVLQKLLIICVLMMVALSFKSVAGEEKAIDSDGIVIDY